MSPLHTAVPIWVSLWEILRASAAGRRRVHTQVVWGTRGWARVVHAHYGRVNGTLI